MYDWSRYSEVPMDNESSDLRSTVLSHWHLRVVDTHLLHRTRRTLKGRSRSRSIPEFTRIRTGSFRVVMSIEKELPDDGSGAVYRHGNWPSWLRYRTISESPEVEMLFVIRCYP